MKKILILTTVSGFLSKFEMENVRILKELGYEIHYATNTSEQYYYYDEKELIRMGIKIHPVTIQKSPYRLRENRKALKDLAEIIRREQIHVIHCHSPVGGLLGRLAGWQCRQQKVKVIYTAHGFHFYQGAPFVNRCFFYLAEKWLARLTDILVVINKEDWKKAEKFRLKKKGSLYYIPGAGLDMERFQPLALKARRAGRKKLGLGEDDFFLLSVGELNQNKNHYSVLLALNQMQQSGKDMKHIRYGICGDGLYREQIHDWIKELHLEPIVTMYGYCEPVQPVLGCADAMIFPSQREGLGMAALEALSMEIPVIASDNRGTREYMEDGKNGFVCRWDDIDGYVRGIEKMCSMNGSCMVVMRQYCRESVRRFEKGSTNQRMYEIYRSLDKT